jgi:hypothetical protein
MLRGFRNGRAYEGKKELWAEGILGTRLQSTSQNEWSDEFVEWPTVKVKRTQKLEGPATVVPQLNLPLAWIGQGNQTVKYPFEPPSERVEELDVNAVRISEVECFVPWFH